MEPAQSEHASDLCTACGMCCGGALFNSISLAPGDFITAITAGLRVESDPDDGFCIAFPCSALDGAFCRVYDGRPEGCRDYRCKTLTALDRGEIALAEGLARVSAAVAQWRAAEAAIAPETIPQYRSRRAAALNTHGTALADDGARAALNALDWELDRHFRRPRQRQRDKYAAVEGRQPDAI